MNNISSKLFLVAMIINIVLSGCNNEKSGEKSKEKQAYEMRKKQKLDFIDQRLAHYDSAIHQVSDSRTKYEYQYAVIFLKSEREKVMNGTDTTTGDTPLDSLLRGH